MKVTRKALQRSHCRNAHCVLAKLDRTGIGKRVVPRLHELAPAARRSQEAGFTQPRPHLLADPCTSEKAL